MASGIKCFYRASWICNDQVEQLLPRQKWHDFCFGRAEKAKCDKVTIKGLETPAMKDSFTMIKHNRIRLFGMSPGSAER